MAAAELDQKNLFKWRHYEPEIILLCVRWYLRYSLSYRDLEEMMAERGLQVDHTCAGYFAHPGCLSTYFLLCHVMPLSDNRDANLPRLAC